MPANRIGQDQSREGVRQIILNFHGVGPVLRQIDSGERDCWLDKKFFESVLDLVAGNPSVQLTVDDGNSSDFDIVLPALLDRGLQATFFVCSGRLAQPTFLDQAQIRQLLAKGMKIGSHGAGHRSWRRLSEGEETQEMGDSRSALEAVCGSPVELAACPFGAYDRRVLAGLRKAGYTRVYTSDGGYANEAVWIQPRTTVRRSMTLDALSDLIHSGPGWCRQSMIAVRGLAKRFR